MLRVAFVPEHPRRPLPRAAILGLALLLGNAGAGAAEPDALRPGAPAGFTNSLGIRLVAIPAGEYTMPASGQPVGSARHVWQSLPALHRRVRSG